MAEPPLKKKFLADVSTGASNPAEEGPATLSSTGALREAGGSSLGLPAQLVEMLNPSLLKRLAQDLQEALEQMRADDAKDEDDVDEAKVREFLDKACEDLPRMTTLFSDAIGARAFSSRVIVYEPAPAPMAWRFEGVYAAETHLLTGGLKGLDELMDGLRDEAEEGSAALWLHGITMGEDDWFLAYLRWPHSRPLVLAMRNGRWGRVESSRSAQALLLKGILGLEPAGRKRWQEFLTAQSEWQTEHRREDVQALWTQWGLGELTDSQWDALVRACYVNKDMLFLYQQCARDMCNDIVLEAHGLLKVMVSHFDAQVKFFNEHKAQLEKDLEKKTRRLKSDLERTQMMSQGVQARAKRLADENNALQVQLRAQSRAAASPSSQAPGPDFVATLDRLFTAA